MKFSLIAAVVALALAQGSFAEEPLNFQKLSDYFEEIKNKMTQDLAALISNHDIANQAQTFLQDKKTQLEPLASQIQEQLKTAATNVEDQIRPLTTTVHAQMQPMLEDLKKKVDALLQQLGDQARAIGN